eukprot:GHVT01101728.1.p1 GENE.GHVT01101728.1~~GHVT01101728.1.p1  ORF type:complete len:419 (-),score=52.98 GHVT01101728.1:97-1353(-)
MGTYYDGNKKTKFPLGAASDHLTDNKNDETDDEDNGKLEIDLEADLDNPLIPIDSIMNAFSYRGGEIFRLAAKDSAPLTDDEDRLVIDLDADLDYPSTNKSLENLDKGSLISTSEVSNNVIDLDANLDHPSTNKSLENLDKSSHISTPEVSNNGGPQRNVPLERVSNHKVPKNIPLNLMDLPQAVSKPPLVPNPTKSFLSRYQRFKNSPQVDLKALPPPGASCDNPKKAAGSIKVTKTKRKSTHGSLTKKIEKKQKRDDALVDKTLEQETSNPQKEKRLWSYDELIELYKGMVAAETFSAEEVWKKMQGKPKVAMFLKQAPEEMIGLPKVADAAIGTFIPIESNMQMITRPQVAVEEAKGYKTNLTRKMVAKQMQNLKRRFGNEDQGKHQKSPNKMIAKVKQKEAKINYYKKKMNTKI